MVVLCDVFIEVSKPALAGNTSEEASLNLQRATRETLWICLDNGLRLLHPIMPFVTEELWQRLPQSPDSSAKPSIMVAEYPSHCQVMFRNSWIHCFFFTTAESQYF